MKMGKNGFNVLIPFCDLGGYGDIIAGLSLSEYFQSVGLPFQISAGERIEKKLNKIVDRNENMRLYDGKSSNLISICTITDRRSEEIKKRTRREIFINEYDIRPQVSKRDFDRNKITLQTGFGFDKYERSNIQAGIYIRKNLEFLLDTLPESMSPHQDIKPLRENVATNIYQNCPWFEKLLNEEGDKILQGNWSLMYSGSLYNNQAFLRIFDEAKEKLEKELFIFTFSPSDSSNDSIFKMVNEKNLAFSYYSSRKKIVNRESPITIIELNSIPDSLFRELVTVADTLSLITGDHSLSQMIQKAHSKLPIPFLYHQVGWKKNLAENLSGLLSKTSTEAANLFKLYIGLSTSDSGALLITYNPRDDFKEGEKDLARLIYDSRVIEDYNNAVLNIRNHFTQTRKNAGIKKPELLWCIQDTIGYIIQGLISGKDAYESVNQLLPKTK